MSIEDIRKKAVASVMAKTGWSKEYTAARIEDAKTRLGITWPEYDKYNFHAIPIEQQGMEFRKILDEAARKKIQDEKTKAMYIAKIMVETGWDYEYAESRVLEARTRTGCRYKEFYGYRFWTLDEETQQNMFLSALAVKLSRKYDVNKKIMTIVYDKEKTNEYFSEYLGRPWCVNTNITREAFVERFANSKKVVYKPVKELQGRGVTAYPITPETAGNIYDELSKLPKGVVEEYVVQHPKMSSLNPSSVNTIRVVTFMSNTHPVTPDGKHMDIAYVSMRVGNGSSVVDNFNGGGMAAGIDMETGLVVTSAANEQGKVFAAHPVTGTVFKGFEVPFFKEILEFVKDACIKKNVEGYIGWDIAITENGPTMIELNRKPSSSLLTAPWATEKRGMKHIMEKYL